MRIDKKNLSSNSRTVRLFSRPMLRTPTQTHPTGHCGDRPRVTHFVQRLLPCGGCTPQQKPGHKSKSERINHTHKLAQLDKNSKLSIASNRSYLLMKPQLRKAQPALQVTSIFHPLVF